jgi:hypothetical protein
MATVLIKNLSAGNTLPAAALGSAELHPGYEDGAKRGQRGHDPAPQPSPLAPRPFFLRVAWMQPGDGPDAANKTHRPSARRSHLMPQQSARRNPGQPREIPSSPRAAP